METLKGMKEERETLGVELYGIQQQLARQQMLVEREQDGHTALHQLRVQCEETLAQVREMYRSMQDQVETDRKQCKCHGGGKGEKRGGGGQGGRGSMQLYTDSYIDTYTHYIHTCVHSLVVCSP